MYYQPYYSEFCRYTIFFFFFTVSETSDSFFFIKIILSVKKMVTIFQLFTIIFVVMLEKIFEYFTKIYKLTNYHKPLLLFDEDLLAKI